MNPCLPGVALGRPAVVATAHCPHCLLPIGDDADGSFPAQRMRCPHCRLGIAAGRARTDVDPATVSSGSAAGVLANAARREDAEAADPLVVAEALRTVAARVEVPVARLRMLDYERLSAADADLPALSSVLASAGSWKKARQAAADALAASDG